MATFERIDTILRAVRKGGSASGQDFPLSSNENNDLMIAQGMPNYTEVARRGDLWTVQTSTAFAAVVALPTTTAKLEIKNNTANRMMVIDTIWSWQLLGTAVVWGHTPWAQVGTAVTSSVASLVVYPSNGATGYTSVAGSAAVTAIDQTVVANGWKVFPGSTMNFGLAAATPGGACVGQVDGRLVVPPGKALHVTVTGSVNTASAFHCGASFLWADLSA